MPIFTNPLAFFALAALPALLAIYWLRSRFRRRVVSSLMLWAEVRDSRLGGTRIERLQTPLIFFIELLILTLLALAATRPFMKLARGTRPLVVILDDSYSMLAGGNDSPRARARKALEEEFRRTRRPSIRFIVAGEKPGVLNEVARTPTEARLALERWQCRAGASAIEESLSLAAELGGELALILVVSDRPSDGKLARGRVQWWSFGESRPNLALVNASRTSIDSGQRCLLEVANLSEQRRGTQLLVEAAQTREEIHREKLDIPPGEVRRVFLRLKENLPTLHARIEPDDLPIDDTVLLPPAIRRPVKVAVQIKDRGLDAAVRKALKGIPDVLPPDREPDLLFTDDRELPAIPRGTWLVQIITEPDPKPYGGPFVLDRSHPLTEGLSLRNVAWGAGESRELPGLPVVMAGDVPLLTDEEQATQHVVRLRLTLSASTVHEMPDWPILLANLVYWRGSDLPGLNRSAIRLGEEVTLTLAEDTASVELVGPDGQSRQTPVQGRRVTVRPDEVGMWEIRHGDSRYPFAVNALSLDESDLTRAGSSREGDWMDDLSLRLEYTSLVWLLLLLVLALGGAHLYLASVERGGTTPG